MESGLQVSGQSKGATRVGGRRGISRGGLGIGSEGRARSSDRGGGTCSNTERINALTGPVHESLTPWKHQSTSPPLEKMVKKSSMAAAGKEPGRAPGTQAAIAAASCCAKRGTRHTSSPGNQLSRTSAQSRGVPSPTPPRARRTDVTPGSPMAAGGGHGRGSWGSHGETAAYGAEGRGLEAPLANGRARLNNSRRGAVTAEGTVCGIECCPRRGGPQRAMLRRALRLGLGRGLLGRGLGTWRGDSTLGKVEGSGGCRGSGMPPVSSYRIQDPGPRWEDSGSARRRG